MSKIPVDAGFYVRSVVRSFNRDRISAGAFKSHGGLDILGAVNKPEVVRFCGGEFSEEEFVFLDGVLICKLGERIIR